MRFVVVAVPETSRSVKMAFRASRVFEIEAFIAERAVAKKLVEVWLVMVAFVAVRSVTV